MSQRFIVLCEELATLQLQLLRREAAPKKLAKEGLNLIKENLDCLTPSSVNKAVVPLYLRSCASLLKHVPDRDELAVLDVLDETFAVAKEYIHSKRNESPNDDCSVLRSIMSIDECYANFSAKNSPSSSHDESKAVGSQFSELVVPVYDRGMRNLRSHPDSVSTQSMLTLMQGTSKVYGNNIKFVPTTADISSLLPIKPKIQMEAKIQRCYGARDLLNRLCQRELSRLDAGMCLSVMAETGFYDGDVCNLCCSALHTSHPLLTSPQLCQIIHSLGILQHRHIHQKFFSSLIDPKKCTADGLKKHVQGLAMLRQPPFSETKLMNGVFLHSLRNAHSPHHQGSTATKGPKPHLRYNEAVVDYELPPLWYIDVGHSLSVLDITHHKFKLSVARQARRSIAKLSTLERCKLLYAVGGAPLESVPTELRAAWENKVGKIIHITAEKLKTIEPMDGPKVMSALLFCGIRDHERIPKVGPRSPSENPVDLLLRTWATTPRERVLELAEKIEPSHFGSNPSQKVSSLVSTVANSFGARLDKNQRYRLGGLCAAVEQHASSMSLEESLAVLEGLGRLGASETNTEASTSLLGQIWKERARMTDSEKARCRRALEGLKKTELSNDLLAFVSH